MIKLPKLFLDLDGVMADFDAYFVSYFQEDHKQMSDSKMWKMIEGHGDFFRNLPPCPGALEFFQGIKDLNPIILTACPKTFYSNAAIQKRKWVRKHLSPDIMVLPVLGGKNKPLFMHDFGDILIDDFGSNCESWVDHGGLAIVHENFTSTKAILNIILGIHNATF